MVARTSARIALFSLAGVPEGPADLRVWASEIAPDALQRYSFVLHADGAQAPVSLRVLGRHGVSNALAAAAVGLCAGLELDAVAAALSAATNRSKWRMQLDQRADGLAVLNDAYNANPDSMAAALASVVQLRRPGGRVIAVLGAMLELGAGAAQAHRDVGALAAEAGVDELLAVGEHGPELVAGFAPCGRPARYWAGKSEAAAALAGHVGSDDVVLVKASRGIGLETIADDLLTEGADR
jgi:UDP-N-acetylmuramoyl-tripeptide--D-alanyl-D-alanine ligase